MHWRFSFTAVWFAFLLAVGIGVLGASAQDIFVTPVPNAPFSGVVKVECSWVLRDGSIVNFRNIREIGRDSRGRIHNESRAAVPASSSETPQLLRVHLFDPQTRISTYLDPQKKMFWTQTGNHPPSTEPPTLRFASPPGEGPPNEFAKEEDLGIREMEGVSAHGVRQTQTIPAESSGTGAEIVITDEYWYSADLRINLMIKHSDPRTGSVTMTVTQISRTEPDAVFFDVPEGYRPPKGAKGAE
jgi:hypothetical protein